MVFQKGQFKRIGVLTSGGDAPGMNAAIRAVVRACIYYGMEPVGIFRGYEGLIDGEIQVMNARSVSNIIHRGGTMLKTARSKRFMTTEGRQQAQKTLIDNKIDGLVTIGGDGTFTGAKVFFKEFGLPIVGIPGTIDNDLSGTDFTIGYDTACNTVIHAIDSIRDTASSHDRLFFIEVMGRDSGFIALRAGLAAGVETILIPEQAMNIETLIKKLEDGSQNKKTSSLVVVAEGGVDANAMHIAEEVKKRFSYYDTKVTVLGHVQRGGSPSCTDRELASRLGVAAVEGLMLEKWGHMVGLINDKISFTRFERVIEERQKINLDLIRINQILSI